MARSGIEEDLITRGHWPLCGIDEAGRGPLAGPVVAAAVIMEPDCGLREHMRDSKQLSAARREILFERLCSSEKVWMGVSMVDAPSIDAVNILNATHRAMQDALAHLDRNPVYALIDGTSAPVLPCACTTLIKGDQSEPSISAASIVAKVTRDRFMTRMDSLYPEYGFARHKGYPTREHLHALETFGPCPLHRRSFRGVR
ncbi:MAG: ribonuclease HII [Desulfomonilia bacterium]|nr:ribonuclease HII [Desulfomonilia bacterium]